MTRIHHLRIRGVGLSPSGVLDLLRHLQLPASALSAAGGVCGWRRRRRQRRRRPGDAGINCVRAQLGCAGATLRLHSSSSSSNSRQQLHLLLASLSGGLASARSIDRARECPTARLPSDVLDLLRHLQLPASALSAAGGVCDWRRRRRQRRRRPGDAGINCVRAQ
jgi:hypothetical protein